MTSKNQNRTVSKAEIRKMTGQRILFAIVAIILILSWILSLIAH
jgi:flagellar biogenesis protein FliO